MKADGLLVGRTMQRKIIACCGLILFLVLTNSIFAAGDQDFSISKGSRNYNHRPHVAVSTKKGDVLIGWLEEDPDDSDKRWVKAVLCKQKKSGVFKLRKEITISNPSRTPEYLDVAYNSKDNSFMAVWGSYTGGVCTNCDLFSRKISAKGKIAGAINQLTSGNDEYGRPAMAYQPQAQPFTPASKGQFLIAYDRIPLFEFDKGGVYTAFLDDQGKRIAGSTTLVSKSNKIYNIMSTRSHPWELYRTADGSFLLGFKKADDKYTYMPYLLKLDKRGKAIKELRLGRHLSNYVEAIQLSKKLYIATWDQYASQRDAVNQLFKPTLKKKKKEFSPLAGQRTYLNEPVKLENNPGSYQLSSDGHYLKGRYISSKGTLSSKTWTMFDHLCLMQELDAACLPGSNRVFIAWVESKTEDWSELKVHIFEAHTQP